MNSFAAIKRWTKSVTGRSIPLTIAAFLADDVLARLGVADANPAPDQHLSGADIDADKAYARRIAAGYCANGAIGGRVAEIGPGGSAAVALYLIDGGADEVDLLDRFRFAHDRARLRLCYESVIGDSERLKILFPGSDISGRIFEHAGESAAAERFFASRPDRYDAICSCAVLEHVTDPLLTIAAANEALRPGGRQIHYVDLRDHAMFSAAGHHPLTFLCIPDFLYRQMSRRRGRPNRVLVDSYRAALARLPVDWEIKATSLVGVGPIDPVPFAEIPAHLIAQSQEAVRKLGKRLAARFRDIAMDDLLVDSILILATKRAAP